MHQLSRNEAVPLTFGGKLTFGERTQLRIDDGQQRVGGVGIAGTPTFDKRGDRRRSVIVHFPPSPSGVW